MSLSLSDYARWSGLEIADLVRRRQISSREVLAAAVAAAEKLNPTLNALVEIYGDADRLGPSVRGGSFHGVPYLRKDIGATEAGRLTEMGSRLMVGNRATHDSYFTRMVRDAGLVCFGRTTCPEFGMSSATESVQCGVTRNPWNLDRMAGGSSGGAAAAVASGIVPIAHASDGGGSIRIPASACGVIGLKPSRGRVSLGPDNAEVLFGLGIEFVMTRTIADTAVALDCLSRRWPGEPFEIPRPAASYAECVHHDAANWSALRIGFTAQAWSSNPVAPEIAEAVNRIAILLADLGYKVENAAPRFDFDQAIEVLTICFLNGLAGLADLAQVPGMRAPGPETLEAVSLAAFEQARRLSYHDLEVALGQANAVRRDIGEFFEEFDVLVTPTLGQTPPPHGTYSQDRSDISPLEFQASLQATDQFLPVFNITGQPALSLPVGLDAQGMPIGVQLVARQGREDLLLQIASRLEATIGWNCRPPVHVAMVPAC